jgi:S1-C subfamily serine protease
VALGLVNGLREDGFIQMSANVSPGNSGGPVLDTYGNVIGLVAAKLSEPSYIGAVQIYDEKRKTITIPPRQIDIPSSGVSLALPASKAKAIADQIIKYGSVTRGYLGIYPQDLSSGLHKKYQTQGGVLITEVVKGSPADRAGLSDGDIIVEFAGAKVQNGNHIRKLIKERKAEEAVELTIIRNGDLKEFTVVLGAAKPAYSSNTWWTEVEVPEVPEIPDPELYYKEAHDYLQQVQGWPDPEKQSLDELRQELRKLEKEMKKLSEELKELKQEKLKE